ncbi:hypothetical protein EIN_155320 [Entamoeba invadens IP1]|uniref:Uncharacterized protein n=2 Tax=Entamoeba invadens TaxID=33085 RepID=A0A0A1U925_ENTIV|nr:hypothetical protein EIN_155320 [Entamoeba invadens IP1]ELP91425.1 hypothetical protein EIN_155320 [Entamoeba invadens IP1]BAN40547.1 hypothetical protein [Entamoeba invadens]|eukprot:XP_004258196.1 hypothetical protein EIN_155320 [Entamoeba invadens IP1]
MSTSGDKKKASGISINMATAKREELIDFIHACSERIRILKQKNSELQVDAKTQTEERELSEIRANDLERKIEAIKKVHDDKVSEMSDKLEQVKEQLSMATPDIPSILKLLDDTLDCADGEDSSDKEDEVVKTIRSEETKRVLEANDMKWKTEMLDQKETQETEFKKQKESLVSKYEEEKKELTSKIDEKTKQLLKADEDLKAANQIFSEYKARTCKTFESGKDFRKEHEKCDEVIFKLKAEVEKLKYENERLLEELKLKKN